MNSKNIRFRILLWYSLTIFFAAAIIFSGFYLVTRQILFAQVDKELNLHAVKLAEIASRQGINLHEAMLKQQLYNEFSDIPGMAVVLLDSNASLVRSSFTANNPYDAYNWLYRQARNNNQAVFLNQNINNVQLRFVGLSINSDDNFLGVVLVAHPVEAIQKSLNVLLKTLGIIFGFLIIPLGFYFNRLLDQLQQAFKRERQFIGDVAHELKTPVAILTSGLELVLSKKRPIAEYHRVLKESLIDVNRLSQTIKNILDLAWLESENARLPQSRFNLSDALNELAEIAQKLAAKKNIRLTAEIAPGIIIAGSSDKIFRAILNVTDNAVKFTPSGKSISLSLKKLRDQAVITIKDTGIGIPQTELPHIFTRFYRGAKTAKTLGSGLGLAIAKGIIKAHQGEINITSQVGKGTCATIKL
ncbi:MAG: HAMP domain-containing sensor histidine kinase [Patescibacteria group bacterium]